MKWSIKNKLILFSFFFVILMIITSLINVYFLRQMSLRAKEILEKLTVSLDLVNELKSNILNSRINLEKYINTGNMVYLQNMKNSNEESYRLISFIENETSENKQITEGIKTSLILYNEFSEHLVLYYQQNSTDLETIRIKTIKLDSLLEFELIPKIDMLHEKFEVETIALQKNFEVFYTSAIIAMIILIVFLGLAGFTFSLITSQTVSKPLEKIMEKTREIAEGKFHVRIKVDSKDEFGELAKSFNKMATSLERYNEKIKKYSEELERKVMERTKELKKRVEELEKTKVALMSLAEDLDETNKKLREAQWKLKKSFEELKKLDIEKDRFISIAAHELKTPLTTLYGFSQLLQDERIFKNKEKRENFLKIIQKESIRLSNIVTNILELSRFDLGTLKLSIKDVDVPELLENIKTQMNEEARKKGLKLEVEIGGKIPKIKTDEEKLKEILINLVNNSIKFTERGGVKLGCAKVGEFVRFSVTDTGIGIPKKAHKKIFTRFFQVESPYTRKTKGSGLGLSVCKALVEFLGGEIWFKSKVGKGTTFYFTLPIKFKKGRTNKNL